MSKFSIFDTNRLSIVLKHANTCRHDLARFYAAKDSILRAHGVHVGFDYQEIDYVCFGCSGKGCTRCSDGFFMRKTWLLERWKIGNCTFHIPRHADAILEQKQILPTQRIKGLIRHHPSKIGQACQSLIVAIHTGSAFDYFRFFDLSPQQQKRIKVVWNYLSTAKAGLSDVPDEILIPF